MKFGLALSGGGARGYAHFGIVKALQEHGIKPSLYAGTSAGAVAGAFLAKGYTPDEAMDIFSDVNFLKYLRPAITKSGLVKIDRIASWLSEYFPDNSFESLNNPLIIAVTNYTKGTTEYFSKGELIKPLLASVSIPIIFSPVEMNDDLYFDGGILNNMPANKLKDKADYIIGINCNCLSTNTTATGMKDMLERCLLMAISRNTYDQKEYCDYFMEPEKLVDFRVFALSKASEIFEIGYDYAMSKIENDSELKKIIAEAK